MMNPFGQLGEMKKMRDQAMQIQKQLDMEEVEVNKSGVFVRISASQKIRELKSNGKSDKDIQGAVNEAIEKAQQVAAKKLQTMAGGMGGLAGLMGGK